MNLVGLATAWSAARRRHRVLDHVVRAAVRYDQVDGGRLAAAVTYYGFFAVFAMCLLGFAVFGFVLDDPGVARAVGRYLVANLPRLDVRALRDARGTVGVVALLALPVIGLFWVDSLRSSIRAVWRLPEYPGRYVFRQIIDMGVLAGLGVLLAATLAVALATQAAIGWLVNAAGGRGTPSHLLLTLVGLLLGLAVNTVLAVALLAGLPRLRMRVRRVLGPALVVAVGLELLKTIGRFYIERTEANPAFQVVAGAVGLLVFLNLVNQLILFAAALCATGTTGQVIDLARRRDQPAAAAPVAPVPPVTVPGAASRDLFQLRLTLCLPRDRSGVRRVRRILTAALTQAGVAGDCHDEILTALSEACANVVLHAGPADEYEVTVDIAGGHCAITVTDAGAGFTPTPDTFRRPSRDAETGRGLYLIATLADQYRLVTEPGQGTTVQFSKRLTYYAPP